MKRLGSVVTAASAGVERIVYLSFIGAAADATFTFARDQFRTEEHIRASGLEYTASRQNLYLDLLPVLGGPEGVIRGPAENGREAPVLRDDVADALVAMLTQPGHVGVTYGPQEPRASGVAALPGRHAGFVSLGVGQHPERRCAGIRQEHAPCRQGRLDPEHRLVVWD